MRKSNIFRISLLSSIVLSIFCLTFFQNVNISHAQVYNNSNKTVTVPQNFQFIEFAENTTTTKNVTSININLQTIDWNITDIEMNFSNIKLERETKIIEDTKPLLGKDKFIYNKNPTFKTLGLSVQLNLSVRTTIYGIYIYGYKTPDAVDPINFQIRGYDNVNRRPNSTKYKTMLLNISTAENWYYQNFSSPLTLAKGNYSIVMNGTGIPTSDYTKLYYWYYNKPGITSPLTPNLYISEYTNSWSTGVVNSTFLYKLVQKYDRTYDPESINMTIEVNGKICNISKGTNYGTGNVTINNLNFNTEGEPLHIPVHNNRSIELNYSLTYKLKLYNFLVSNGTILIKKNSNYNNWTITLNIIKYYSNQMVRFSYPKSWNNFTIFKNYNNITKYSTIDELNNLIVINDCNITSGLNWFMITANSPNFNFELIVLKTKFDPRQEIIFTVNTTGMNGNLTYVLIDSLGYEKHQESKTITASETVFSYILPPNPNSGNWNASIYWYNTTDAGYKSQTFQISSLSGGGSTDGGGGSTTTVITTKDNTPLPEGIIIDPLLLVFIAIIGSISAAGAGTSYIMIKRFQRIREAKKQKLLNRCIDVLNLNYVIIMDNGSGLSIYEQLLAGKQIEGTLISGFLQALRSFGIELTGAKEESQTIKLEYQDSKILMSDFKNFRLLLVMKDLPSSDFSEAVKSLSYEIEEKYGNLLKDFNGDVRPFREIQALIEKHLNTTFVYPLKIDMAKIASITKAEKTLIDRATDLMKANEMGHFYMLYLMGEKMFTPKDIKIVFNLLEKKILVPAM